MLKVIYPVIGKERILPFYLTGIGVSSPEYRVKRENGLVSYQILFTKSGEGIFEVDGQKYPQKKGSCFFLPPGQAHEYYPINDDWETYWIVFRGEGLKEFMGRLGFVCGMEIKNVDIDSLMRCFNSIYIAAGDSINGGYRCSNLIYEYILLVYRQFFDRTDESKRLGNITQDAICYIDDNISRDIGLEELAGIGGVSLQHFCRVFKSNMGMRPMEYVARKRIATAKLLLDSTELSITEIAQKTGYSDAGYFGMVFRRFEGMSPTQYRRNGYL
ncbi:AraC family transcriptional regulator [Anaeromicropila herbilytica]|uniref:HTH araC/xylS-type domain-containing protein n=1 Tax=Anaeromicropila herbilytica TaxID=2785025 RepID=A0A7R7IDH9_9FIRM|nr:AraC family transcriptional regulator [Anaeromicropila herbilytica]BCN31743.1 hypothetical protein bsdtb5_30380 [Anaeromicropila herbilytica]